MRYLFIVQGDGRGHITEALSLQQILLRHGHEVVEMLAGVSEKRTIPEYFARQAGIPVKTFKAVNFILGKDDKRPDMFRTVSEGLLLYPQFTPSIRFVADEIIRIRPDVIVNFYETVGQFAFQRARMEFTRKNRPKYVSLAPHHTFQLPELKWVQNAVSGANLLTWLIGHGADKVVAIASRPYPSTKKITVIPPLLRSALYQYRDADGHPTAALRDDGFICGYLLNAGFADEVIAWHQAHPEVPLYFFWDSLEHGEEYRYDDTLIFHHLDDTLFLEKLASCHACAMTSGFESVCECIYLGKPMLLVPVHEEQRVNATVFEKYGYGILSESFDLSPLLDFEAHFPDQAQLDWFNAAEEKVLQALTEFS